MAISQEAVKELERITADLGDLIQQMRPGLVKEWDVFDGAVAAHKNLRKLDTDSLRQLELPLEERKPAPHGFREDCPHCHGWGSYRDPASQSEELRPCSCNEVQNIAWEEVKKEWEEALKPVEA